MDVLLIWPIGANGADILSGFSCSVLIVFGISDFKAAVCGTFRDCNFFLFSLFFFISSCSFCFFLCSSILLASSKTIHQGLGSVAGKYTTQIPLVADPLHPTYSITTVPFPNIRCANFFEPVYQLLLCIF
ncbi:hypothetical protein, unlikely [Trypanosoma congolense IL3000]|uniref:Uncharacterized protein n=1 Tax=Trypanosoma congolense (strain IL3000) TaxID=1068625 RepID=F9W5D8_TRYCI|nr:hypothetical protein, unlikely [Trypanosoma congolense IL3000]